MGAIWGAQRLQIPPTQGIIKGPRARQICIKRQPISIAKIDNNSVVVHGLRHKISRKPQRFYFRVLSLLFFSAFLVSLASFSLFLVYCSRQQARKRYKCCPWGAHLLLPFQPTFPPSSPSSSSFYFLLISFFSSVRRNHFPPERFRATSSPARSTRTLGFDDLLLFLVKTPRICFAIPHRANRRDDMWLATVKLCLFCFSELETNPIITSTCFFRFITYLVYY